jgi:hypothetical protein
MSHLLREHAPITETGWKVIDDEARARLTPALAARKLVDFAGPSGWEHSATNLGRTERLADPPVEGIWAVQRRVLPLTELRAPFSIEVDELRDIDRGARDVDLGSLDEAARRLATAENSIVFHGWERAGILGIAEAAKHDPIVLGEDCARYPRSRLESSRATPRSRHRWVLRARARPGTVYACARDQRARRLPAAQPPAQDPRRPARLGSGNPRCCRSEYAWR